VDLQTRRQFLGRALVAGAGTTLFYRLDLGGESRSEAAAATALDSDPGFLMGRVVSGSGDIFSLVDQDSHLRAVHLGAQSHVWKQGLWDESGLAVDDCLYARGEVDADGVFVVDKLWVAIHNFASQVVAPDSRRPTLLLPTGDTRPVPLIDRTEIVLPNGRTTRGDASPLRRGQHLQVIGFGSDPLDGNFTASRIIAASSSGSSNGGPDAVDPAEVSSAPICGGSPDATCAYTYLGVTSWMCCKVNACGSGGFSTCNPVPNQDACCGACDTSKHQIAWPNITNCGGNTCNFACCSCCASLPKLSCGFSVSCYQPCTGKGITAPISDCGPCVRCVGATGCKGYDHVKFDLTACAFTYLGGNLNTGLMDLECTVCLPCPP
jgi:hypothetical protein